MEYKYTYQSNELNCINCLNNVSVALEKFSYIKEVYLDYDNNTLTLISLKSIDSKEFIDVLLSKNHCEKCDFSHIHKIVTEEYNFEKIDCPNCASKLENSLNKEMEIVNANVDFINKKVIIKHLDNVEVYDVVMKNLKRMDIKISEEKIKCFDECCHHHEEKKNLKLFLIINIVGLLLYLSLLIQNIVFKYNNLDFLYYISYLLISYNIIIKSIKRIINKDIFNEELLMIIASLGALFIKEYIEAILVILLYRIGEHLQNQATEKSKNSIKELIGQKVKSVTLKNGEIKLVEDVIIGDIITIKVGEMIPLDGILEGEGASVDMSSLTGEADPVYIESGQEVLSGSINLTKVVNIVVTKNEKDSSITKIANLIEDATLKKSKTEMFITKFSHIYTPIVLLIAFVITLIQTFIMKTEYSIILHNVFTFLVISCPCALVISIPLCYFAGIGRSSASGIFTKGSEFLDALSNAQTFIFDKTGTITKGNFTISNIHPDEGIDEEEILNYIVNAEKYSTHPIAQAIKNVYKNKIVNDEKNCVIEEIGGLGLDITLNNEKILIGNKKLMDKNNIKVIENNDIGTAIYLSVNNKFYGSITIVDKIKESSARLIKTLNRNYKTIMLTGDNETIANHVGKIVGIMDIKAKLLPNEKYEIIKNEIKIAKKNVVFVGDGLNDSPSLKIADVGIAMGNIGSDAARECADIVIMNDDLESIQSGIIISKYTKRKVIENIILSITIKVIAMLLGILGLLGSFTMIVAVLADVGACLLAIYNASRILKLKIINENIDEKNRLR